MIVGNIVVAIFLLLVLCLLSIFFLAVLIELVLEFFLALHASRNHVSDWGTIGLAFLSTSAVIIIAIWERIRLRWQGIWKR